MVNLMQFKNKEEWQKHSQWFQDIDYSGNEGNNKKDIDAKNIDEVVNNNNQKVEIREVLKEVEKERRKWEVYSISLKLSDIHEFEWNVRLKYDEEEIDKLVISIQKRGVIDNIEMVYIKDEDKYIISDGHRTFRALKKIKNEDDLIEVFCRKVFKTMNDETIEYLMEIWLITNNLKVSLTTYEQIKAIINYLKLLKRRYDKDYNINNKEIYDKLGFSKSKSSKYARIINNLDLDFIKICDEKNISYKFLSELSYIEDEDTKNEIIEKVKNWEIKNKQDLHNFLKKWEEDNIDNSDRLSDENQTTDEFSDDIEEFKKQKEEDEKDWNYLDLWKMDNEDDADCDEYIPQETTDEEIEQIQNEHDAITPYALSVDRLKALKSHIFDNINTFNKEEKQEILKEMIWIFTQIKKELTKNLDEE